ncbi:MAG: putative LPS assembly protein LptD [Melioribacteraceae bacterium]|nr:putative LPS assembly protein LptD [Melioribacteraceae bacterium]
MKVIYQDKVIARWIMMYIGGVPVPIPIPFAVFPAESGRRSGIIAPSYGKIGQRGWYFRNFGYFLAISNYMDLAVTGRLLYARRLGNSRTFSLRKTL